VIGAAEEPMRTLYVELVKGSLAVRALLGRAEDVDIDCKLKADPRKDARSCVPSAGQFNSGFDEVGRA
jgi:hypothetical protein